MSQFLTKLQFSGGVRRNMYQSFADYLAQGIPLNDIVELLAQSIRLANAKSQMFQTKILDDIALQMSTGVEFTEAIAKWIPMNEAMSIRAGMKSGDPVTGMINTIDTLDSASVMKKTMISKLSYPAVLLMALVVLIFFFSVSIIPNIAQVMDPSLWPESAQPLYSMATFVQEKWWVVLASVVSFGTLVGWTLPRIVGAPRKVLDRLPPYSFYKAFHGANMLISMASLMRSGIPLVDSLHELRKMSTPYMRSHLERMIVKMSDGGSLGEALDTGLLSAEMMVNVHMMSHNANFQSAISAIGQQAIKKSIERIGAISGMLNGVALFGVAGYVGWVYFCFFTVSNAMSQTV